MITCGVCGTENDEYAVLCASCKAYLQSKVEGLDLFATIWGLIESPTATFRRIVLSKRKNFVTLLAAVAGIAVVFGIIWFFRMGTRFTGLMSILAFGMIGGPIAGIVTMLTVSTLVQVAARIAGGKGRFRDTMAATTYASFPVGFSLIFIFPLLIANFGMYLFDQNPSPMVIKPVVYSALLLFDVAAVLWALGLSIIGLAVAHRLPRTRAVLVGLIFPILVGAAGLWLKSTGMPGT
jgi:hypothetical protein